MKGKLYLSSIYTIKNLPNDIHFINIARKDMNKINDKRIVLAPSRELFNWYLNNKQLDNWFDIYEYEYLEQIRNNKNALNELINIKDMLDNGLDVCLLCFCRKSSQCHRGILGEQFKYKGYEVVDG